MLKLLFGWMWAYDTWIENENQINISAEMVIVPIDGNDPLGIVHCDETHL